MLNNERPSFELPADSIPEGSFQGQGQMADLSRQQEDIKAEETRMVIFRKDLQRIQRIDIDGEVVRHLHFTQAFVR